MPLHLTKVAVGCRTIESLEKRTLTRARDGEVRVVTRMRPKRMAELVGGSLYWIVKHRITARNRIVGFAEGEDRRTVIYLDPMLVAVKAAPKRAHQGWRYLAPLDAPADFDGTDEGISILPPGLAVKLAALALI